MASLSFILQPSSNTPVVGVVGDSKSQWFGIYGERAQMPRVVLGSELYAIIRLYKIAFCCPCADFQDSQRQASQPEIEQLRTRRKSCHTH